MSASTPALITGVVTDEEGRPVAEAAVSVQAAPVPVPDISALTGSDGRFTYAPPVPGRYTLAARAPGYRVGTIQVGVHSSTVTVELRLTRQ